MVSDKTDLQQEELIPLLVLVGPTAVGKTEISISLCKNLEVRLSLPIPSRFIVTWI